jgi:O-antigen/teichoic acid export membrane protein
MRALAAAPFAYMLALILSKAAGFVMLPLVTSSLSVVDYARLEVLASVADVAGVICGLGLVDAFFRFGTGQDGSDRERRRAELLGCAILAAVLLIIMGQAGLSIAEAAGMQTNPAMRFLALSVALTAAIELPLGWLRSEGRAWRYSTVFLLRTLLQCGVGALLLMQGFGVDGLFAGVAVADLAAATLLVILQGRASGIAWPRAMLGTALRYGGPLALGGIAGFALGSLDRWFLAASVSAIELAHYGLAVKFGALVVMAMQPFGLWWYPRRLAVLNQVDGAAQSAQTVGIGLTLLWCAAACVSVAAPLVMRLLLPEQYWGARDWVPYLAVCFALHETASLVNVGSYRGNTGVKPMMVNWIGAGAALIGYAVAIPYMGAAGAILATAIAHALRVILFLLIGRTSAPVDYPWRGPALAIATLLAIVWLKPLNASLIEELYWAALVILPLSLVLLKTALPILPFRGFRHAT